MWKVDPLLVINNVFLSHADSESQSKDSGKQVLFYFSIFANKHILNKKKICHCRVFTNSSFWLVSSGILWYIWIWNTLSSVLFVLSDLWRPCSSTGDGLRNGDVCSSSLAAKGYRSVRPIFQDKTSPTPVRSACLLHSFVFLILAVAGGFPSSGNACGSPFDRFY